LMEFAHWSSALACHIIPLGLPKYLNCNPFSDLTTFKLVPKFTPYNLRPSGA
jgi:hypothetical protein